jgi:uncharacterized repeat protein (TIGR02543 family)
MKALLKPAALLTVFCLAFAALSCDPPSGSHPPAVFTLTYHANNADSGTVPDAASITEGAAVTAAANTGTLYRTGWAFGGWNTTPDGDGTRYAAGTGTFTMPGEDVNLYAEWLSHAYTVTYSTDDGTTVYTTQTVASPATTVGTLPANPTLSSFYFGGWYTAPNGAGSVFSYDTPVTTDITVYAAWSAVPVYAVTFAANDGSAVETQNIAENGLVTEPADPSKPGYTFGGWYTDSGLTDPWDFASDTVTGATTLYARWVLDSYTLTFYYNEGTGTNPTSYTVITPTFSLAAPTRDGYTFGGWYTDAGFSGSPVTQVTLGSTGEREYWAKWIPAHVVIFNANGGSGSMADQVIGENQTANLNDNTFTFDLFILQGWAETPTGAVAYAEGAPFDMGTADVTLYAVWQWDTSTTLTDLAAEGYLDTVSLADEAGTSSGYLTAADGISPYIQATSTTNGFQHNITPFEIGQYEVTYELWYTVRTWAEDNGYTFANAGMEGSVTGGGSFPNYTNVGAAPTLTGRLEPVTMVNWRDAIIWCNAYSEMAGLIPCYYTDAGFGGNNILKNSVDGSYSWLTNPAAGSFDNPYVNWSADGYRLPTEGEWQYVASCAATYPYNYASGAKTYYIDTADAFGYVGEVWTAGANGVPDNKDTNDAIAVYYMYYIIDDMTNEWTGVTKTAVVGSKRPNAFGLYDMSGNVYELCWDYFGTNPTTTQNDYRGTASGSGRSERGGSWDCDSTHLNVGNQNYIGSMSEVPFLGFRVVRRP